MVITARNGSRTIPGWDDTRSWVSRYQRLIVSTDIAAIVVALVSANVVRFGYGSANVDDQLNAYAVVSVAVGLAWLFALAVFGTRDPRVIGAGSDEFKQVLNSTVVLTGIVGAAAFLLKFEPARGYVLIAFPLGFVLLCGSRWLWRVWLNAQRRRGAFCDRVVVVGSFVTAVGITRELTRFPESGYRVIGVCVPQGLTTDDDPSTEVPILGTIEDLADIMRRTRANTVIVSSSEEMTPKRIRELSWSLEPGRQHLVVAPGITDVAGPRIHTRPLTGLPLIHVEIPHYSGPKLLLKRLFDIFGAIALLVFLSPVFIAVAVMVRATSSGAVLYKQERIGRDGEPFAMLKFRSMIVNADAQLAALLIAQGTEDRPLFKVIDDPRITPIGKVLRKYSLDEFPQLFNVVKGDMSLVGPRPQRQGEVELYDTAARRRLIVQPGMTGLWQVSGRSSLSWEDAIRLDLYYVENWSVSGDLAILWRTIRAVVAPGEGAF